MTKTMRLKLWSADAQLAAEFTFPKCDPRLDDTLLMCWRAEEMNVIGHDHVSSEHPAIGHMPSSQKRLVNSWIGELVLPMKCAHG